MNATTFNPADEDSRDGGSQGFAGFDLDELTRILRERRWLILAAVVLGSTVYNATVLMASGLQPQMQGAMSATQDEIAWVMTFNIVAQSRTSLVKGPI